MKRVFFDLGFYAYRHCSAAVECMDWGDGDWCDVFRHGEAMQTCASRCLRCSPSSTT